MNGWYYWAAGVGVLGVLAILAAAFLSLLGIARRDPQDPMPPFAGATFACMVLGAVSFIGSLLLMAGGST